MRSLVLVVLLASCVDEPPVTEPGVTSYVVRREIPMGPPLPSLSIAYPCFEQTIPEPFECAAWLDDDDGTETVLPPCDDAGTCWRIVEDPTNCFDASHQLIELDHFAPRYTMLVMECVVRVL